MRVDPYTRPPAPPRVALLTAERVVVDEDGGLLDLDTLDDDVRVWCSYDTARQLTTEGHGEALCWGGEEIRWRHTRHGDPDHEWKRRRSDVAVLKLPFPEPAAALEGLRMWRDWLASYGASATGTSGSAAWSLLRATLSGPLWCTIGDTPPLKATVGGRQLVGPLGAPRTFGSVIQWDLPAAYASELGGLTYGGRWEQLERLALDPNSRMRDPAWWAERGYPVFVHAQVTVPGSLTFGPLPRRPRARPGKLSAMILGGTDYPTGTRMTGVWTWQEIQAGFDAGMRLGRILDVWVHRAAVKPFETWWAAVVDGRRMPGLAGRLAKTTGNALWGRFCMDPRAGEAQTIRHVDKRGRTRSRRITPRGFARPAHDLAETVAGRVRAELFRLVVQAGDGLVCAHTDGAWTLPSVQPGGRWRAKDKALELDLIGPQCLRYVTAEGSNVIYAGFPSGLAPAAFADRWGQLVEKGLVE